MESFIIKLTHHMDKASTEISEFFRFPAKSVSAMVYQISKLHIYMISYIYMKQRL